MADITEFLERVDRYIETTGLAQSTVSRKLFGGGARLGELRAGSSPTLKTLSQAKERLAELETAQCTNG